MNNRFVFLIAGFLMSSLPLTPAISGPPLALFSAEEAAQLKLGEQDLSGLSTRPKLRAIPLGPRIELKSPPIRRDPEGREMVETREQADLLVEFLKTGAEVDMNSLEVEASKGVFSLSLTERLRPYIHGNRLEARKIDIPMGKFNISIRIADQQGRSTDKDYLLVVH